MTVETDSTKQPAATGNTRRRRVLLILKLAVAGGLLTWLFVSGRLDFSVLLHARNYGLLAMAGLVLLASLVALVWRWLWLIRIQGLSIPTLTAMRFTWRLFREHLPPRCSRWGPGEGLRGLPAPTPGFSSLARLVGGFAQ